MVDVHPSVNTLAIFTVVSINELSPGAGEHSKNGFMNIVRDRKATTTIVNRLNDDLKMEYNVMRTVFCELKDISKMWGDTLQS